MTRLVMRMVWMRWVIGMLAALSLPLWLPEALPTRIWCLTGLSFLTPWMVIGLDQRRRDLGIRQGISRARRAPLLVCLEMLPPLTVILAGAMAGTGGRPAASLCLAAWAMALVAGADALDRRAGSAGGAWTPIFGLALAWCTAPLWLGGWFGSTAAAPWLATLSIGLHPAAAALDAADLSTLQDAWFYTGTLSGVVEAHPVSWLWGLFVFIGWAALAIAMAIRAARLPERRVV